jgi:hypothetical protein
MVVGKVFLQGATEPQKKDAGAAGIYPFGQGIVLIRAQRSKYRWLASSDIQLRKESMEIRFELLDNL